MFGKTGWIELVSGFRGDIETVMDARVILRLEAIRW